MQITVISNEIEGKKPGSWWFGGGADLTPSYLFEDDAVHFFHQVHKDACDRHKVADYAKYKQWCDDYFHIKHRGERRGLGGIFFDDVNDASREDCFEFVTDCESFLSSYLPILERRKDMPYTAEHKVATNSSRKYARIQPSIRSWNDLWIDY